jgi:general secretion pathway protein G
MTAGRPQAPSNPVPMWTGVSCTAVPRGGPVNVESYAMPAARRDRKGFTLVELLIVVIILAILAAVVIPQMSNASSEAKESALRASLNTVRQAISLYRVQHNEAYPGPTWNDFVAQLTTQTDNVGGTSGILKYGPYLRTGFPDNPVVDAGTGKAVSSMPAAPSGTEAWIYALDTGELRANQPGVAPSGLNFFDL